VHHGPSPPTSVEVFRGEVNDAARFLRAEPERRKYLPGAFITYLHTAAPPERQRWVGEETRGLTQTEAIGREVLVGRRAMDERRGLMAWVDEVATSSV